MAKSSSIMHAGGGRRVGGRGAKLRREWTAEEDENNNTQHQPAMRRTPTNMHTKLAVLCTYLNYIPNSTSSRITAEGSKHR